MTAELLTFPTAFVISFCCPKQGIGSHAILFLLFVNKLWNTFTDRFSSGFFIVKAH